MNWWVQPHFTKSKILSHQLSKGPVISKPLALVITILLWSIFPQCGSGNNAWALELGKNPKASNVLSSCKVTCQYWLNLYCLHITGKNAYRESKWHFFPSSAPDLGMGPCIFHSVVVVVVFHSNAIKLALGMRSLLRSCKSNHGSPWVLPHSLITSVQFDMQEKILSPLLAWLLSLFLQVRKSSASNDKFD
jgi:hypothetical protein